ncbi:MAG: hypothetical protein ACT4PE_09385 [Candidatus Eiseniibacteriota bacterium]
MECFYHAGAPAVGSCRSCLKGLCRSCAVELEGGLACPDRCEEQVRAIVAALQQSARYQSVSTGLLRSARGLWSGLTVVALFVGLFVAVWGLSLPAFREIAALGIPFLALALITARLARNTRRADAPSEREHAPAA